MVAVLLLALQIPLDERALLTERFWKADSSQFYKTENEFGASRIESPQPAGSKHMVMGRSLQPAFVAERFLVGNFTDPFDAQHMRTTYVPISFFRPAKGAPEPTYKIKDVESRVRAEMGKEFMFETPAWRVQGFRLLAKKPCLSCHNWAKEGDTLGYLVYTIGGKRAKVQ